MSLNGKLQHGLIGIAEVDDSNGGNIDDLGEFLIVCTTGLEPMTYQLNLSTNGNITDKSDQDITTVIGWGNFYMVKWWYDYDDETQNNTCRGIIEKYMDSFNSRNSELTPLTLDDLISDQSFQ